MLQKLITLAHSFKYYKTFYHEKNPLLVFCSFLFIVVQAQLPDAISKAKDNVTVTAGSSAGKLLTQFGGAIKPTSLLSSFAHTKKRMGSKAGKVTNAVGMASSVASLAKGIKPDMFKSCFNVNSLIQTAGTVKTISGAGSLLNHLQGGLKQKALSSSWAT